MQHRCKHLFLLSCGQWESPWLNYLPGLTLYHWGGAQRGQGWAQEQADARECRGKQTPLVEGFSKPHLLQGTEPTQMRNSTQ